jgi:hypothetical protein
MLRTSWSRLGNVGRAVAVVGLVAGAVAALALVPITAASARRASSSARAVKVSPSDATINPAPAVTVDTNAHGGTGISIEGPTPQFDAFYTGEPGKWLHVVVLNRDDLKLVSNTNYDCPQATEHPYPSQEDKIKPCIDRVRDALAKLNDRDHTNLVIATSQYDGKNPNVQPPVGMFSALYGLVSPWKWWNDNQNVVRGTYSAIGIPGEPSLGAEKIGGQLDAGSGRLINNLGRDNEGKYVLVPGEQIEYDTQAPGSDAKTNVIEIGDKRYRYEEPGARSINGFMMLVVDTQTLDAKQYFFTPNSVDEMAKTLRAVNDAASAPFSRPKLVFIASRGLITDTRSVADLATQLTRDGGTRTRFMDAVWHSTLDAPDSYTLVGRAAAGPGDGLEAVGGPKSGTTLNTVPLIGTLERTGPYYDFRPQSADNAFSQSAHGDVLTGAIQLLQTVGRLQSDWPWQGNAERTAAIAYLGDQVLDTPYPQTQYWTIPWNADRWKTISEDIAKQPYPSGAKFGPQDLDWAKTELEKEIRWLNNEHEYMDDRAKPFSDATLKSWAELQSIASEIDKEVKAPDEDITKVQMKAVLDFALDLSKELPLGIGKGIAVEEAIYKLAIGVSTFEGEPVEDEFSVKVGQAGKALVDRMTAAEKYLSTDVPAMIASDPERLKIVGSCGAPTKEGRADCPFDASNWQFTSDDQTHAAAGLLRGSKVTAYGALLPAKYQAWRLPPSKNKTAAKYAGRTFPVDCYYPFKDEPETGQVAVPESAFEDGDYEITALGYLTGRGTLEDRWKMHVPEASVTNPLFGTGSGELGVNKEEFFSRFFPSRDPLPHYPEDSTPTGWDIFGCR